MTNKKHFYIDAHVLQTVPPSCVNRDDTGSPKTAVYGGVTRARVSSQAWKHAMRLMFRDSFDPEQIGYRTKLIVGMVKDEISLLDANKSDDEAEKAAIKVLEAADLSIKDAKKGTDALFFMSPAQARALAELAVSGNFDKKDCKEALAKAPSVDMALFGRMVASDASLNYDAAAQVAHSISTHGVHNEYDYFTAVDDCTPDDQTGAGHLGTVEFNSATLYRYATVNLCELRRSLGDETPATVRNFLDAFIRAMPTGKQNTFANRTLPDTVYITIRGDQPINMCGSFEKPVQGGANGYSEESQKQFVKYAKKVYGEFATTPIAAFAVGEGMSDLATPIPLPRLLDEVENWVKEHGGDCGVE